MVSYTLTCHVQGHKRSVSVDSSGAGFTLSVDGVGKRHAHNLAQAEDWAIDEIRDYFASHLRHVDVQWGLRVAIRCGTFDFGDWSLEPLRGTGRFPEDEPILQLYRKWSERHDPQNALTGARQLVRYCLGGNVSSARAVAAR